MNQQKAAERARKKAERERKGTLKRSQGIHSYTHQAIWSY